MAGSDGMVCPYCHSGVVPTTTIAQAHEFEIRRHLCPRGGCGRVWAEVVTGSVNVAGRVDPRVRWTVWPRGATRPVPPEVDPEIAAEYAEAVAVGELSPKASAALSRRLLQRLIRERAGIERRSLSDEIDALIDTGQLAAGLAEDLHAVRHVGNFAAHPLKDTETGTIVDVDPAEAEWLLDLLDDLFDHFYVKPAQRAARRERMNEKLARAGKPLLPGGDAQ